MLPHKHALISAAIGAIGWWGTRDPGVAVAALAAGVLPDLDHGIDYGYYRHYREHRLILALHGYEYAVIGGLAAYLTKNRRLTAATVAYLMHLLADQLENQTHTLGYSLVFRIYHHFQINTLSKVPESAARGREDDMRRVKALIQRLLSIFLHFVNK